MEKGQSKTQQWRFGGLWLAGLKCGGQLPFLLRKLVSVFDRDFGHFGIGLGRWDVDTKEAIQIAGFGAGQIVTGLQFQNALKGTVGDFHDKEAAFGRAAIIGTIPGNAKAIAFHGNFEAVAFHPRQFNFNDETFVG